MLYERNDIDLKRGTFRVRGDSLEIVPAYERTNGLLIEWFGDEIDRISEVDTITGHILKDKKTVSIFAASHFVTDEERLKISIERINKEKEERTAKNSFLPLVDMALLTRLLPHGKDVQQLTPI